MSWSLISWKMLKWLCHIHVVKFYPFLIKVSSRTLYDLCVCTHAYLYTCLSVWSCACLGRGVHMCPWTCQCSERTTLSATPQAPTTFFFFRQGIFLAQNLPSRLEWLTCEPEGSSCLCFLSAGITSVHQHTQHFMLWLFCFYLSSGNWSYTLLFARQSSLLSELYPQPDL